MPLEVWIIFTALIVAAVLLLPRILPPTGPTCTRCEGTGAVNERWPDPSKPGGWHELSTALTRSSIRHASCSPVHSRTERLAVGVTAPRRLRWSLRVVVRGRGSVWRRLAAAGF